MQRGREKQGASAPQIRCAHLIELIRIMRNRWAVLESGGYLSLSRLSISNNLVSRFVICQTGGMLNRYIGLENMITNVRERF